MTLSNETFQKLSTALKDEVIDYIHQDERYAEMMMEVIPDAIQEKLGLMDCDILTELSCCIMDKIFLR
jgi:hypothetical protein